MLCQRSSISRLHLKKYIRYLYTLGSNKTVSVELNEPAAPIPGNYPEWCSEGVSPFKGLKDGATLYMHVTTPTTIVTELCRYANEHQLKGIEIIHSVPKPSVEYLDPKYDGIFRLNTPLPSEYCHEIIKNGRADYMPIATSELPLLYRKHHVKIDFALICVTPPDRHGFCSLGATVGTCRSAIQNARVIVAQVNPLLPTTYGDSVVHQSQIQYLLQGSQQTWNDSLPKPSEEEETIGKIIAENLVEDGATIQFGQDGFAYALSRKLFNHRNLGIHSSVVSDGIVDLVKLGVITNAAKRVRRGRIVASYAIGTKKLFDFIDKNPLVALYDIAWTNAPENIARNPKVTSINKCVEVDLTGQVVSEGIGEDIIRGNGCIIEYTRGACIAPDHLGRPIIALCSKTPSGGSSVVPTLTPGSAVVCTRAHTHYLVTEYGIASLFGKTLRQRAYELIKVAHPEFRESLERAAFERLKTMPSP